MSWSYPMAYKLHKDLEYYHIFLEYLWFYWLNYAQKHQGMESWKEWQKNELLYKKKAISSSIWDCSWGSDAGFEIGWDSDKGECECEGSGWDGVVTFLISQEIKLQLLHIRLDIAMVSW